MTSTSPVRKESFGSVVDDPGLRPRLSSAAAEVFTTDWFRDMANRIVEITKGVYIELEAECRHCGNPVRKKVLYQAPDVPRQITALTELMNQIEGRPGSADVAEQGMVLVVERNWPTREGVPS